MISIIVTCYNESAIISEFIPALNREISKIEEEFEIIFIDSKIAWFCSAFISIYQLIGGRLSLFANIHR